MLWAMARIAPARPATPPNGRRIFFAGILHLENSGGDNTTHRHHAGRQKADFSVYPRNELR
jgi:hypothetical protein